jgi:hypothetical protein
MFFGSCNQAAAGSTSTDQLTTARGSDAATITKDLDHEKNHHHHAHAGQRRPAMGTRSWTPPFQGGRASTALTGRLRYLENSLEEQQRALSDLLDKRAAVAGPLVLQRLADLDDAVRALEIDRQRLNLLLRQLLTRAIIDHGTGEIVLEWKHGGSTTVRFAWREFNEEPRSAKAAE